MIKEIEQKDIAECVKVIRESFKTVADEHRWMCTYYDKDVIVGYYSILVQDDCECELSNRCVIPTYRHKGIGEGVIVCEFVTALLSQIHYLH